MKQFFGHKRNIFDRDDIEVPSKREENSTSLTPTTNRSTAPWGPFTHRRKLDSST